MTRHGNALILGAKVAVMAAAILGVAATTPAHASAHTPAVAIGCRAGLTVDLDKYDPAGTNRVRVRIDGALRFDRTFPAAFHSRSSLGSAYVNHTVAVRVIAWDDPDGSLGYSRTFRLVAPPCKERITRVHPAAHLYGPFLDPMYYARFDNRGSDVACTFRWSRIDGGTRRVVTRTVAPGRTQTTKLRHADGGTRQTITGCGQVLVTRTTAPGGTYPAPR